MRVLSAPAASRDIIPPSREGNFSSRIGEFVRVAARLGHSKMSVKAVDGDGVRGSACFPGAASAAADRDWPRAHRPTCREIAESHPKWLEQVYRDFDSVSDKPGKRESLPGEDVFWWCVTILEELEEVINPGPKETDPYLLMMIEQLKDMGGRLERNEPLPSRFGIHWFDELDDEWDDDDTDEMTQ